MSEKISSGKKTHCLLQFTICAALAVLCPGQTVTVLLDAYSLTSTLTDNPSTLPLGTTVILTCRTAGIPQGTDLDYSYTWSCPEGLSNECCNKGQGRNPNRKTYEDRLVLHILSTADTGTYTCSVGLATGEVLGMDEFQIIVDGGLVLHHGLNLIADNDFITDVQGITSDGMTSISCDTTDQEHPQWRGPNGEITTNDTSLPLYVIPSSNPATLVINSNNIINFTNAEFTCNTTQHTASVNLYFGPGGTLQIPTLTGGSNGTHQFIIVPTVQADKFIFSYERQDFNVALAVEYQEVEGIPGTTIAKSASIPGVTYRIVLWAVEDNQYSSQPSSVFTFLQVGQAPSAPRNLTLTRTFTGGLELNWIPPKETNAEIIRYEIQYGPNTSDYTTVDTGRSDTYYNLTVLQNTTYYIRVVAVNYVTANGEARTEGEWITATVMMPSPPPSTTQPTASPSTTPTNSTTPTATMTPPSTVSPPTSSLAVGIAAGVGGGVVLILIIVILVAVIACLVVRRRGGKEKQHPPPTYYNTPGEGEKEEGVLIIANEPEVQYTYIRKESLEKTGSLHSSHSSIHNTISNEHAKNGTAEQQNQTTGSVEYASIEEIRRSNTPNAPQLQEYATIDSNTSPLNSGPPVAIGGEYATVSDQPSGMEYSTIGELPAQGQTVAQSNPNTSTLPQMRSQAVLAREGNDSVVDAVAGRPLPDPSYDAIDNNQSTPLPASAYDTVDNNLPPPGGAEYESVPERPPMRNDSYERIENGGGNNVTVSASASRPTGGYETIDDSDQPVVLGNGTYELVDTGGTLPTSTTSGQEQQSSTDNLLDEGLYADMYSESNKPSSPNNNNNTEADVSNKTSVVPLSKNQADELYSTPDMTRKPKKKSSEDPSPKEEEYAPAVPGFNPDILYAQPDKNKKLSEDPAPKEEDFYATNAPGFNPDILYAQPDKNKKLSEDPALKEEDFYATIASGFNPDILYAQPDKNKKLSEDPAPKEEEYAPTVPEFNPDILYAQPDKNKKLREDPAPKEEDLYATIASP